MTRKTFTTLLKAGLVVFLLVVFLFADRIGSSADFAYSIVRGITAVFRDLGTQRMVFLCMGIYFAAFLFLRDRLLTGFWRATNPSLWLALGLLIGAIVYAIYYSPSLDALTLLAGAGLGQGAVIWTGFEIRNPQSAIRNSFGALVVSLLVILLALASVWNVDSGHFFEYRSHARWFGPWDNPNIAGLLMGAGAALATGMAVRRWKMEDGRLEIGDRSWKLGVGKYAFVILFLFAAGFMARGLLHSYSRGAWLAAFCGMVYLVWSSRCGNARLTPALSPRLTGGEGESLSCSSCFSWLNKNCRPVGVILFSVIILSFCHFRQTEWHPVHRVFSVSNQNDFSWRNRIAAWEGALQMMADKPLFGAGWNRPEPMYDHYYRAPKVVEGMAIQLNDYLMFGATLGIPALFCFATYIWLSLTKKSEIGNQKLEIIEADWSKTVCRAGAIVLLVGFWFDGGLFKLATGAAFWILLELGRADLVQQKAAEETKMHPMVA